MSQNFTFNMTLCFLTYATTIANIRLDVDVNPKEPFTIWDIDTQSVATTNVRNFIGVDNSNSTLQVHGLFAISVVDISDASSYDQNINTTLTEMNTIGLFDDLAGNIIITDDNGGVTGNQNFFLCYDCDVLHNIFPSIVYHMLFQDIFTYK